jgi:hypothetical protein
MLIPFLLTIATAVPQAAAARAEAMTFGVPRQVGVLEKIKGEPIQIAWSPDGTEIYLETGNRTRIGTFESQKHYLVNVSDGKPKSIDAPPQWATDYQAWKSNKWAPGIRTFAIDISEEKRTQRAVNIPMGGDLAKGGGSGGGTSTDDVVDAAVTSQMQHVITLHLKGETVGEYVDMQFVPGYTFGWAPQSFGTAIAYGNMQGHLAVMDQQGGKKELPSTSHVLIPSWSDSGKQIAYLQKDGKKFALFVVDVK